MLTRYYLYDTIVNERRTDDRGTEKSIKKI